MDEYRPYPTDQPDDETEENEEQEEGGTQPERPAPPSYRSESRMSASDEEEDEDEDEDDEEDEPAARSGGRRGERGERGERAAPNLDHPGGHLTGTVARLNRPRRFGFLRTDDGMEIFFHASALESGPSSFDQLRSGQGVEFDCHQDEAGRGLAASLVQVVGPPPPETPRAPRQQREPREPREREEGQGRGSRGGRGERGSRENWRVEVLTEGSSSARAQLERLLNERNVKPGNLTLGLLEGQTGTEVWVAYYVEEGGRR